MEVKLKQKIIQYIFNNISRLPNFINYFLMKLNVYPPVVYGKSYAQYKNSLKVKDNQEKLFKILNFSLKNIKYYRDKYPNVVISTLSDFKDKIGFINKDIVMKDIDDFISVDLDIDKFTWVTTGGTSGKPLRLAVPVNRHVVELGTVHNYWVQYGYKFSVRAVLRNHKLLNKNFMINPITKEVIFDGFNMTDENFCIIYKTMKKYKISFLQCYPSSGYAFANYLKKNNLDTSFLKAFFVSSENVLEYQKESIKTLGIQFFNLYGHSEKLVIGGNCPYHDSYHIDPDYGYMELVDENDIIIEKSGVLGEIVGTTFNNYGMPLIRYKTGDYAEYLDINCECGFKGKTLKSVEGRWNGDKIFNKSGTYTTTTALNLHNDLYSVINGIQYVQNEKGLLEVNVIPGDGYSNVQESNILRHFQSKMNDDCDISIHKVNFLKRQSNGKFLLLLSSVKKI
jgi:phenylacetate-CoA ligase